jgi:NarL family two-component system response regulator LiaR
MTKIRVIVVDDHRLMVEAVRLALEADGDFDVVGSTTNPLEAPNLVAELTPDLVILDVMMPNLDGLACLRRLRHRSADVKVVMLSATEDDSVAQQALQGGASAFVLKQIDPRDLGGVLRQALSGPVTRTLGRAPDSDGDASATSGGLSPRELDVLRLLADGLSNQQIAQTLFLAEQTVKFHLSSVYRKLQAKNRTEAVTVAVRRGIVQNPIFASGTDRTL